MLTTVVHNKKKRYDVYIGRPTKWRNPFIIGRDGNREQVLARYREWLLSQPDLVEQAKTQLKGKVLGCWCDPLACHGHILAEIVNSQGGIDELKQRRTAKAEMPERSLSNG